MFSPGTVSYSLVYHSRYWYCQLAECRVSQQAGFQITGIMASVIFTHQVVLTNGGDILAGKATTGRPGSRKRSNGSLWLGLSLTSPVGCLPSTPEISTGLHSP